METLKPELRFPEFKKNWESKLINEILSIGSGKDYKHLEKGNIPVFGTGGLMTYVNDFLFDGETVCIGRKGTIDKPMYFKGKLWTVDTLFYTNKFVNSSPKFIFNLFQRINWKEYNEASGVPSLSKSTIEKIEIKIPSIEEQTKIANFLSSVDEKLNLFKEKKSLLEGYKKGIMQKIFNQEIRFKDDNGNDFEEWEIKTLGEVGSVLNGLTYSPDDISEDGVLVLRSSNIKDNRLKFEDNVYVNKNNFTAVVENDILICVRNGSKNLIGKNTLITKEIEGVAFGAFMSVYRSNYNRYLIHWFGSNDFFENVNLNLGATINSINGSDLKKFKIPFPCAEEQTKIANFLSAIDEKIELVSNQIQDTQEYKRGLLQQMFA